MGRTQDTLQGGGGPGRVAQPLVRLRRKGSGGRGGARGLLEGGCSGAPGRPTSGPERPQVAASWPL